MDEYSYGATREAAARTLGQEAARSFARDPVEGSTIELFVLGDVTSDIIDLTRQFQQAQQRKIKNWRRRHFLAPIALAVIGIVTSVATTPRQGSDDSAVPYIVGFLALLGGVAWFIANAFRASAKFSQAQRDREVETGRLLEIARDAAAETYRELADAPALRIPDDTPLPQVPVDTETARTQPREARLATGAPAPAGQAFGVTQSGAKYLVAGWMRYLGESDAATTPHTTGTGLDVTSATHVARVNNDAAPVNAEQVRELVNLASIDGRGPVFFASGTYEEEALAVAEQSGVTLLVYDAVAGTLDGANALGLKAVAEGL